jgi:hypothetical protein
MPYQNGTVNTFGGSWTYSAPVTGLLGRFNKYIRLQDYHFKTIPYRKLLEILKYNHPDVSQAVWNFKILGNNSYKAKVTLLDGETEHKSGQLLIDSFLRGLDFYTGTKNGFEKSQSVDKLIGELIDMILIRGAVSLEMVLTADLDDVLYFTTVDPETVFFEVEEGRIKPFQFDIDLDVPTFFHEGLDETARDPYGTTPFISAIQAIAFQMQVMADLKMVVHNQGYGKVDIKIVEEVLLRRMPVNIRNNEKAKQQWLNDRLNEIITMYSKLDPDAAYVHYDSVEVDMVENGKAMFDPQGIMAVIDTQMLGALKQYSTLMGRRSTGQTEQYAKLEIKLFMQSVKKIQKLIESVLSRALTKYLNMKGMQGYVFFEFDDIEIRTELEQANFEQVQIANAAAKRNNGWYDNDDASKEITGKPAKGEPDKEMLGVKQPAGAPDERKPSDPKSSDSNKSS